MKKIFSIFFVLTFLFCSCTKQENIKQENIKENTYNKKIIATWVTYQEIKGLIDASDTEDDFKELVFEKMSVLKNYKVNIIFLHVRAFDDCFYKSDIYPVSIYCSDKSGSLKYDVLENFITVGKQLNIEIHAWINPYRIRNDSDKSKINKKTFAYSLLSNSKEDVIITDDKIYYNPSSITVQKYILDGVKEILDNYDVNGIHIDDYFYPKTSEDIDKEKYSSYLKSGGKLSLDDYRRHNVSSLISSVYTLIKNHNNEICFSISPNGDIDKNYNSLYADVKKWLIEDGYADYIIPQIYFGYENESMPYRKVLNDWILLNNSKLIIGLGLYKSGRKDKFAKIGETEWVNKSDIISNQIDDIYKNNLVGFSLFSSSFLTNTTENINLEKEKENIIEILEIYES